MNFAKMTAVSHAQITKSSANGVLCHAQRDASLMKRKIDYVPKKMENVTALKDSKVKRAKSARKVNGGQNVRIPALASVTQKKETVLNQMENALIVLNHLPAQIVINVRQASGEKTVPQNALKIVTRGLKTATERLGHVQNVSGTTSALVAINAL
jgi:hypothetical protein